MNTSYTNMTQSAIGIEKEYQEKICRL